MARNINLYKFISHLVLNRTSVLVCVLCVYISSSFILWFSSSSNNQKKFFYDFYIHKISYPIRLYLPMLFPLLWEDKERREQTEWQYSMVIPIPITNINRKLWIKWLNANNSFITSSSSSSHSSNNNSGCSISMQSSAIVFDFSGLLCVYPSVFLCCVISLKIIVRFDPIQSKF